MITTSLNLYKVLDSNAPTYAVNNLRNTLARAFLDDQPYSKDFYALSYVWGDSAAVCDVEINGVAAMIGANLYAALHAIQKNTNFRVLWVDALCINQSDKDEKSWQVQQMAAIYSRARATISWLGPPSADSKLALETLAELDKKTRGLFWSIQEAMEGGPPTRKIKNSVLQIASDSSRWNAIVDICARPYWSRIWIFQEMACARDRYFLCGDYLAREINRPIALLLAWQVTHQETRRNSIGPQCLTMLDSVQTFRFHGNFPHDAPYYIRPGTLHDILLKLTILDTGEIRDKIYAPLAVATDRDELGIVPDYSKDLDVIFTEAACALLRAGYLGVLLSAGSQDKTLRLPSWVPDWSAPFEEVFDRKHLADKNLPLRLSTMKALPQISDHVTLDGYVVGKITWIHDTCPVTSLRFLSVQSGVSPTFAEWLDHFEVTIASMNGQKGSDRKSRGGYDTPESAIAELICAVEGQRPVWSLLANPYLKVYNALKSAKSLESLLQDLANEKPRPGGGSQLTSRIQRIQQNLEHGSKPYLTDSGAMGLTWKDRGCVNDLVVLIPGARVPCLLRPFDRAGMALSSSTSTSSQSSGHYQLVSVTYVHGIMYGEFFERKNDARQLQSFTLY
jgi:hypothetical protein